MTNASLSFRCFLGLQILLTLAATGSIRASDQEPQDTNSATTLAESESSLSAVWANTGEDKVTRDELRASRSDSSVQNSVFNGEQIDLCSARNETVSFNLVLEAASNRAKSIRVDLSELTGPGDTSISSRPAQGDDLFNYVGRNIELFYVRYLQIKGISKLGFEHYDERHVPQRFRRPFDKNGQGRGRWEDRPDHDKFYPDIAVPLELHSPFSIDAHTSQSIWADIYVPKETIPGSYQGTVVVYEGDRETWRIPVRLIVRPISLPDLPNARTMLYISEENINRRYLGEPYPGDDPSSPLHQKSLQIVNRHFQLAHRHRISLIGGHKSIGRMGDAWVDRLSGKLFTRDRGYAGVGIGVGNNVFSIGTYGNWPWKNGGKPDMWAQTDAWVKWFEDREFDTPTDYFLFLIDESDDFPTIEKWSRSINANPGPGRRMQALATVPAPKTLRHAPSLDIPVSTMTVGIAEEWRKAVEQYQIDPAYRFYMYNGARPASGTFTTEDDGVALRELVWGQFKMNVERWFVWEGTYYNNFQGGTGETNVFKRAQVFGGRSGKEIALGETGWNYENGNGVLFYPGMDTIFPNESYDLAGPFASLRLKYWRRGLQDFEYLVLATEADPERTRQIVQQMVPRILWEIDATDANDPTWVLTDISWPTNPDRWEAARMQLADIIEDARRHDE